MGKWIVLIFVFVFVMVGLTVAGFILNFLTYFFFGTSAGPQATPANQPRQNQVSQPESHEERDKAYHEKVSKRLAKEKHSPEELAKIAHAAAPKPLSLSEYDPKSGKIVWPGALLTEEYQQPRDDLSRLLRRRAASPGGNTSARCHEDIDEMLAILKHNIKQLSTTDYIAARKFLDSLAHML